MTEEQLRNIPMKEVIGYCHKNEQLAQGKPWMGGKQERAYKEFRKTIGMVKHFHKMYVSGVWDKQTKKDSHHMTWNELFNKSLT